MTQQLSLALTHEEKDPALRVDTQNPSWAYASSLQDHAPIRQSYNQQDYSNLIKQRSLVYLQLQNLIKSHVLDLHWHCRLEQYCAYQQQGGKLKLLLHEHFLEAPFEILNAIADMVLTRSYSAIKLLERYMNRFFYARKKYITHQTHLHLDVLQNTYQRLNADYFKQAIHTHVRWIKTNQEITTNKIRLGVYYPIKREICIHPILALKQTPEYYLQFVLYHEMCHAFEFEQTARQEGTHNTRHNMQFKHWETQFKHYQDALSWEQNHLSALVKAWNLSHKKESPL